MSNIIQIEETPNIVDDHLLDIIGNEFKFDHTKGMAEWLKNSIDAYRRENVPQHEQVVVFRFTDKDIESPLVECIDFIGMEQFDIEKAFKRWGDPNAAKRDGKIKVYGGHGNGGKFYMRQMFEESRFITYKKGALNIFGFSKNKKYGYAKGFQNKSMPPKEALGYAGLGNLPISDKAKEKILKGETGFTVIQGMGPVGIRGNFKVNREMERFKNHPQSRRILLHANISIVYNGHFLYAPLKPDELEPMGRFETPRVIEVPHMLPTASVDEMGKMIEMSNQKYNAGRLVLKTSSEAMAKGTKLGELNRIDFLGEIGVIGSSQLFELGVTGFPDAAFIYGECEVPILEDPVNDCVSNDRSKLVKNDTTDALMAWVAEEIDKLAAEITALKREKQKESQKDITSRFNDVLNQWKNKYMKKIMSELFGGESEAGAGSASGTNGIQVTAPINGFDFKYPYAEIQLNSSERITLKVSVPEALPIGAAINISIDNDYASIETPKHHIKSEFLKTTPEGNEVAFMNFEIIGKHLGDVVMTATAGNLTALIKLKIVEQKERPLGKGKSFPRVLLSGQDDDPLGFAAGGKLFLGERDPVVFQRRQDVEQGIYWINTQSPMASKIYDRFKFDSVQWRNFLFDRYVDIFVKESIHELWKKDYENFNYDTVDQKISDAIRKTHESAKEDLADFLFNESYTVDTMPIETNEI